MRCARARARPAAAAACALLVATAVWPATAADLAPSPGRAAAADAAGDRAETVVGGREHRPLALSPRLRSEPRLVLFDPAGAISCGGAPVQPLAPLDADPLPTTVTLPPDPLATPPEPGVFAFAPPPVEAPAFDYSFDVSAEGRVRSLRAVKPEPQSFVAHQPYVSSASVEPALAALPFAPGRPLAGCRIHLQTRVLSYAEAGQPALLRAFALGTLGPASPGWRAAALPTSDCYTGAPLFGRVQHFVAVDQMREPSAARSWSVVSFDVTPQGRTANLKVVASSGRRELDAAALDAQRRSTYAPTPKHACVLRYFTPVTPLVYPATAKLTPDPLGGCPNDPPLSFSAAPTYPTEFKRRSIEGYAVARYDIAPWGAVGAVEVVTSEPAEAFGERARQALAGAHAAPSAHGSRGCLQVVRFKMNDTQGEETAEQE